MRRASSRQAALVVDVDQGVPGLAPPTLSDGPSPSERSGGHRPKLSPLALLKRLRVSFGKQKPLGSFASEREPPRLARSSTGPLEPPQSQEPEPPRRPRRSFRSGSRVAPLVAANESEEEEDSDKEDKRPAPAPRAPPAPAPLPPTPATPAAAEDRVRRASISSASSDGESLGGRRLSECEDPLPDEDDAGGVGGPSTARRRPPPPASGGAKLADGMFWTE